MTTAIKRAAVAWACAGALLLAWSGVTAGMNAGLDDKYDDQVAAAQRQQQFWKRRVECSTIPGRLRDGCSIEHTPFTGRIDP